MNPQLVEKAKEIIEKIIYITLATTSDKNIPWNSPVFAAYDKNYNFYWRSGKDAIHSQNIKANGKVFITIFNSTVPWGTGKGVFIQARAEELTEEKDITNALALLDKRSGKTFGNADKFVNEFPRRVYKAIPEKIWVNVDGEIDGHFVDKRIEIHLD